MTIFSDEPRPTRFQLIVTGLLGGPLLLLAAAVAFDGLRDARTYPNLRVEAESFQWSKNCPYQGLGSVTHVPKRCAVRRYRLRNATELGLRTIGRNTRWYRLGDDALLLSCFRFGNACEVRERVVGKFKHRGA